MNEDLLKLGNIFVPAPASQLAGDVDQLLYFIIWLSTILFIPIVLAMIYFIWKYKKTATNQRAKKQVTENHTLEFTWTIIPLILVMVIFYWGFKDSLRLSLVPDTAKEIHVTGKKWFWVFDYPKSGKKSMEDLVVPVNTPIKLIMSSEDVIHSFYIPNLRVKRDVLPNRYTTLTFTAEREGNFQIFCTEYCGDGHSKMLANLKVVSDEKYNEWLEGSADEDDGTPLAELGKKVYTKRSCNTCHSLDGSKMSGPSWKGLYNAKRNIVGQDALVADDNYLRESIMNPKAKIVEGYEPRMPSYAGLLSDREINALIAFIKEQK